MTEAKSAKRPASRPVFEKVLEQIEKGKADGILCWQINRLSRNPVDSGRLQMMLQDGIIKSIRTMDREYQPTDNVLLFSVESGMANQFILDLRKNTLRGLDSKVSKGWLPARAPTGYLNDVLTKTIVKDPDRFHLVRKMWDLMLTGNYNPTKIIQIANDEWGFLTPKRHRSGDKPLADSMVYKMFNNKFYAGIVCYNGKEYQGAHEPMISLDEFDRVQVLMGNKSKPKPQIHEFSFTGIIRCGTCGCYVTAEEKTKHYKTTSKGLYAIIDLHYVHDTYPNDADVKAFWTKVAPLFKDHSNVLFEPYNEPINKGSWGAFKPIMQTYVDIIRKAAPRNLICVGSPSWDQVMGDAATNPITGGNIVYTLHMYGEHWKRAGNVAQAAACAKVHPMITTEWGFRPFPGVDNTVTNYGKPFTDWMEKLGISWTTWCASDDWGPTMFDADAKGNWTLQVGEGYAGGFTKDLLYARRNANQPVGSVGIQSMPGRTSHEVAITSLVINGNRIPVDMAATSETMQILSLQGRVIKSYSVEGVREIVESDRILPGVYLASSGIGSRHVQSKFIVR
jgi:DNA invertase Pin-like site-specific DNA recombinase